MTNEEREIMADLFFFLREYSEPPAAGTDSSTLYWARAAQDMHVLVDCKWKKHPLAMELGIALYQYLEAKSKAKGGASA